VKGDAFEALLRRTPVTAELTLYTLLLFIPLGVISGLRAGWRKGGLLDLRFRTAAYVSGSLPPFITALFLLGILYTFLAGFLRAFGNRFQSRGSGFRISLLYRFNDHR